ncbi:response regulator [Clavibacter michiganensis]|uniref:Transcriptional regulatory protein n=1 Tax=Clavibacter michiganensis subsp. michiganensis (strain NCPPB 382) TaxID=443906 RepID=A5CS79_CLAM3|nr:response regulator [Clavibacter michiganensis]KAF0259047.1 Transcriptional regulatory protein DcuR [Clavibacter michiganensis subsp. michiganensis]MBE3077674.1 response regulator [Clavibacter michiganensis subsp. michiganensis]MBF4637146.1 response regulator [Clavibacter michiganensis subsp. michiganensis]MBW8026909.1 response regulator [Clavibacter michiganensis subsp. michiganensis]MDO4017839.1 response regulator [Clavibacter michiganensis]
MIRVLVVDDDALTAEAHALYVGRLDGFEVTGVAHTGGEALRLVAEAGPDGIDLVLLDMTLPDMHGLEVCRRLRAAGRATDVVAVTAVRDQAVVRSSVTAGIVQYLIKPFTFAAFAEKMAAYVGYREGLGAGSGSTTQLQVDRALAALRSPASDARLPKGMSAETLDLVRGIARGDGVVTGGADGVSAAEVSGALDVSRVTARRYLEYLADVGQVERVPRYGTPGRPELGYRWTS